MWFDNTQLVVNRMEGYVALWWPLPTPDLSDHSLNQLALANHRGWTMEIVVSGFRTEEDDVKLVGVPKSREQFLLHMIIYI